MKLKLGDFLRRRKDAVDVTDGVKYKRATIRINHKGISIRDEKDGTQIKTKRQFSISKGQFLLSKIDARNGAFGIVPDELDKGIITGNFWTFDVDQSKVLIAFFKAFTESATFTDICIRSSSGTTNRKYLDEKKFLEIEIEVPDIEKQTVVISNYHQKKEAVKKLQDFGVNQREILSNLRQSILQEAVQGKLTESWRANSPKVEPASELLKRIEAEKQQLMAESKIKKEKPLPPIGEDEIPYELPEGWVWCRLTELVNVGTGSTPAKSNVSYYQGGTIPWYTSSATNDNYAKVQDVLITQKALDETNCKVFPSGSLIIALYGQGKTRGQISEVITPGATNQAIAAMVFFENSKVVKEYLKHFFKKIYHEIRQLAEGGAQPNLNVGKVKNTRVPLPPLEEIIEIVEKVNSLMVLCDELEQQIKTSQTKIEQLIQSCLKEVFEYESN